MIHLAMILCAVVMALLLVFSTYQAFSVFNSLSKETGNYIVRQKAAHSLMEASDYLTEMVQRFTQEGETVYLDNYFEEAFTARRREAAIVAMSEGDADQTLVQQVQEAMNESQTLMYREYYAMRLVIEAREIQDYPETLRSVELTEQDAFLSPEEQMDLAQRMVMGTEYYASKEKIRTKLKYDLETLDQMMAQTRQETSAQMLRELTGVRAATIIVGVLMLALIIITARLGTVPLIDASREIRERKRLRSAGCREFRELVDAYNGMYDSIHPEENDGGIPEEDEDEDAEE